MRNIIALNVIISLFIVACSPSANQVNDIYRINREQKLYELSVIWKELSYNFANMDNCPGLDIDSLYQAYISIILNTENDFEYCKALQRFMASFNNGHVYCEYPDYVYKQLGYLPIATSFKNKKIIVDNITLKDTNEIHIGDEIVAINGINAIDYFQEFCIPYVSTSNEETKIHDAIIHWRRYDLILYNTPVKLEIRNPKGIKKLTMYADNPALSNYHFPLLEKHLINAENIFLEDTFNNYAYIRLTKCDSTFEKFFIKNYENIRKYKNLIIDISHNSGGGSNYTDNVINYLINNDSIYCYRETTKENIALYKARGTIGAKHKDDKLIYEAYKKFFPYYNNTAFKDILHNEGNAKYNAIIDHIRYKGNVYVMISSSTISAAEYFATMLSQNKNITFLGSKTAGAMGLPLPIFLPSGIKVFINTTKTYDFQGNDISSGISPDYEYDFSEFYKTGNPNEMLSKFIQVVQELKE